MVDGLAANGEDGNAAVEARGEGQGLGAVRAFPDLSGALIHWRARGFSKIR